MARPTGKKRAKPMIKVKDSGARTSDGSAEMPAENLRYAGQTVSAITTAQLKGATKSSDIQNARPTRLAPRPIRAVNRTRLLSRREVVRGLSSFEDLVERLWPLTIPRFRPTMAMNDGWLEPSFIARSFSDA